MAMSRRTRFAGARTLAVGMSTHTIQPSDLIGTAVPTRRSVRARTYVVGTPSFAPGGGPATTFERSVHTFRSALPTRMDASDPMSPEIIFAPCADEICL